MTLAPAPSQFTLIRKIFTAIDHLDATTAATMFAADIRFTFGNSPTVRGRGQVEITMREFFADIAGIRHELTELWQVAGDHDIIVAQMTVHYSRLDGVNVSLPCCNVFRTHDGAIVDYRIYMDVNPVFSPGPHA